VVTRLADCSVVATLAETSSLAEGKSQNYKGLLFDEAREWSPSRFWRKRDKDCGSLF